MHTTPVITRPLPQIQPKHIKSKKIPHQNPPKPCPTPKSHNTTPYQCPYSRSQQIKPSNPQPKPISGPPPTTEICLNQLLVHLISLNGNPQSNTLGQNNHFKTLHHQLLHKHKVQVPVLVIQIPILSQRPQAPASAQQTQKA